MQNKFNKILVLLTVLMGFQAMAQEELLTVEEAVSIALENNYQIRIATNELEMDKTSVSPGYAGMLPSINAVANTNDSFQNIDQTRSDGTKLSRDNAKNKNLNYGVQLDWTIFDGLQMFSRYDELQEVEKRSDAELKLAILETVSDVMTTYFDLVQQKQQLASLDSTIVISKQRVELANNRFSIGKASKLELLNAQVDENTDQALYLRGQALLQNTKTRLNEIIGRDIKTAFKVVDLIPIDKNLELDALEQQTTAQNPQLQAQLINKRITELQLKQIKGGRLPTIGVQAGYMFSDSESSLGFTTNNMSHGFNYGFSARLNLFDGFNQNRSEKIAKIQIDNSEILIEQQTQTLLSQLAAAFQTYKTNLQLMELEVHNEAIAKENMEITMAKYKIGTIPTIEFRTAQLNYRNAVVRSSNAVYAAKLSEITLKELAGNLSLGM